MEADWEPLSRHGHGVDDDLLLRQQFIPFEPLDHVVHEHENLQAGVFFTRAHPRPSPEGNERVRSRPGSFESCRIKFFWFREALRVLVGGVGAPIQLQNY